ncbi:hypothetical protein VTO42DRAFT_5079 [Malbranchea cinnamomea]
MTASGSAAVLAALANRRSYYGLRAASPIPDSKIRAILSEIMLKTPSSFNSQSTRAVVLLKAHHQRFWDIVRQALIDHIGADQFAALGTGAKMDMFRRAYGTVLFYEDQDVVKGLKEQFPLYADHFDSFSEHTNAMHQLMAWIALEAEGFGANLQHYNPLPDAKAAAEFGIPASWKLRAQLVFGAPETDDPVPPKEKKPLDELLRVLGADE